MTALGTSLVAFRDVALCDRADHEVAIVTDGQRAYVYPLDDRTKVDGDTTTCRVGVILEAVCPVPECDGHLSWRIDVDGCWGADGDALTLLAQHGQAVER